MIDSEEFHSKLTRYAHLLFSCATKYDIRANRWRDIGNISAGVTALAFLYFSVNPNWLILAIPVIAFFYIKSILFRSKSNRIFEMIKTAHVIKSCQAIDIMYEYANTKYNQE